MPIALNPQNRYEVLTPNGFEPFIGLQQLIKPMKVSIKFEGIAKPFECSPRHRLRDVMGTLILAEDLVGGEPLEHAEFGQVIVEEVTPIPGDVELYDVLDAGRDKLFITDGLTSHNCEFIGSSDTLLSGDRLNCMTWQTPISHKRMRFDTTAPLDIHRMPVERGRYVLIADVAGGNEGDYSAFTVIDIGEIPYRLAAKYRSNKIRPALYADVIAEAAELYNYAFVLVEINDLGAEVARTLQYDLEYENVILTSAKGRIGPQVGGGFGKNVEIGLRTTKSTKRQGCFTLKTLIETEKLLVEDYDIYEEFTRFVANNKGSYSAEVGGTDDLVMTLVNFAWLSTQRYFKDLTDTDFYIKLRQEQEAKLDDVFFGFFSDGVHDDDEDGPRL